MENIEIKVVENNIEICRDLCNELMAFQKSKAYIAPEAFDYMNFDTRLKVSYENSFRNQLIVVEDNGEPVGYIFSTIGKITDREINYIPDWAPKVEGKETIGLYPKDTDLPELIGTLSQLYIRDKYRGLGLGSKLFDMAMEWIKSFPDTKLAYVFISNGNEDAYNFYIDKGFTYGHDVFGGFIKAAYIKW